MRMLTDMQILAIETNLRQVITIGQELATLNESMRVGLGLAQQSLIAIVEVLADEAHRAGSRD